MSVNARDVDIAILLPNLRGGGAERVNINLANEFVARGLTVDMVLMQATGEMLHLLDKRVHVIGLGVDKVRHLFVPLASYIRNQHPVSMLACMWPLTIVAVLARLYVRKPFRLILVEHTTWSVSSIARQKVSRLIIKLTMHILYQRADKIIAVSKGASLDLAGMARIPIESVCTIYNPIVSPNMTQPEIPISPESWVQGTHKRILAVGTLSGIKDFQTLIRAFSLLLRSIDAKLLILGDGGEMEALRLLADELGISDRVLMPGFKLNPAGYFAHADLHVLSSICEGFSVVIVEALEQGTPIVSTDCPSGPREILQDGKYGKLVPMGDVEALAQAMLVSLQSPHDHAALKARARDFAIDKIADQYLDYLLPDWRAHSPGQKS